MPLPAPERGLVISYAYLWHAEHAQGREDGTKNRPCVIILAAEAKDGDCLVTVAPITHTEPAEPDAAVEIPLPTKRRLALDSERSWVILNEVNRFWWPGPDLRPIAPARFDYGFLPPALFQKIQKRLADYYRARQLIIVTRSQ